MDFFQIKYQFYRVSNLEDNFPETPCISQSFYWLIGAVKAKFGHAQPISSKKEVFGAKIAGVWKLLLER